MQFFDFKTNKAVNPLESITHFFINPYMPENNRILDMEDKIKSLDDVTVGIDHQIPVLIYPIGMLLHKVAIKWREKGSGIFLVDKGSIYFKIINDTIIRIDTVLFR